MSEKWLIGWSAISNHTGIGEEKLKELVEFESFPISKIGNRFYVSEKKVREWLDDYPQYHVNGITTPSSTP